MDPPAKQFVLVRTPGVRVQRPRGVRQCVSDPELVGPVHVATFCNVLLHLRDPFLALQQILRLTTETVIMTETIADRFVTPVPRFLRRFKALMEMVKRGNRPVKFYNLLAKESMLFMPVLGVEASGDMVGSHSEDRPAIRWGAGVSSIRSVVPQAAVPGRGVSALHGCGPPNRRVLSRVAGRLRGRFR